MRHDYSNQIVYSLSGVNSVFFKRHLKLFEEPENIGFADLGNQNLRTSPSRSPTNVEG